MTASPGGATVGIERIGNTVHRPMGPQSPTVHKVLEHLEAVGFEAPRFLGIDEQGREILSFVEGEVAGRPEPGWIGDERRANSVARLLRKYDDAVAELGVLNRPRRAASSYYVPVGGAAQFMGHLDVSPYNVVFRDGRARALIDFDTCAPASPMQEAANLLLWWAPLAPPEDRPRPQRQINAIRRAALLLDAYGLAIRDRRRLFPVLMDEAARIYYRLEEKAENRGGRWLAAYQAMDVEGLIERRQAWLHENEKQLRANCG